MARKPSKTAAKKPGAAKGKGGKRGSGQGGETRKAKLGSRSGSDSGGGR